MYRPRSLPLGAEWLNEMPTQRGEIPPSGSRLHPEPVKEFHRHLVPARDGTQTQVVDWQYACVGRQNIGKGTDTNKEVREWVKNVGMPGDDAGHIIGKNQGGLGTETWNLFPQNANFKRGTYAQDVEKTINNGTDLGDGNVEIWSHLRYEDAEYPGRPTELQYFAKFPNGVQINDSVLNPRPFNTRDMAVKVPKNYDTSPMKAYMTVFDSKISVDEDDENDDDDENDEDDEDDDEEET